MPWTSAVRVTGSTSMTWSRSRAESLAALPAVTEPEQVGGGLGQPGRRVPGDGRVGLPDLLHRPPVCRHLAVAHGKHPLEPERSLLKTLSPGINPDQTGHVKDSENSPDTCHLASTDETGRIRGSSAGSPAMTPLTTSATGRPSTAAARLSSVTGSGGRWTAGYPGRVRRQQHPVEVAQRIVRRERLGVEHVERRARRGGPTPARPASARWSTTSPLAALTRIAPCRQPGRAVDQPAGLLRQRRSPGRARRWWRAARRGRGRPRRILPGRAATSRRPRSRARRTGRAHAAPIGPKPDDPDAGAVQLTRPQVQLRPAARPDGGVGLGQLPRQRQRGGEAPFGDRDGAHPGRVGQRHARRRPSAARSWPSTPTEGCCDEGQPGRRPHRLGVHGERSAPVADHDLGLGEARRASAPRSRAAGTERSTAHPAGRAVLRPARERRQCEHPPGRAGFQ